MTKLKWFSGGNDREKQADIIITDLLDDLKADPSTELLQKTLKIYLDKLAQKGTSIPLVLSRMNLDISKAIRNDGIILSDDQAKKIKELMSLSAIKYGY